MNIKKAAIGTLGVGAGITGGSLYLDRPADNTKEFEEKIQIMSDEAKQKDDQILSVTSEAELLKKIVEGTIKYPFYDKIEEISSLAIDYTKLGDDYIGIKKKLFKLEIDNQDLLEAASQLVEYQTNIQKSNEKVNDLQSKLEEAKQELFKANDELEKLGKNFAGVNKAFADLTIKYQQLQKEKGVPVDQKGPERIKELEDLLEKAKQDAIDKGKQLDAKIKELVDTVSEKDEVEEEVQTLKTKIEELKGQIQELQTNLVKAGDTSQLQKELDEVKKQLKLSKEENDGLKTSIEKISVDMSKLEKEKNDLQDRYDESQEELTSQKQGNTQLEINNGKLTKQNADLLSKIGECTTKISQYSDFDEILDENADLNVRLDGYIHKNEKLSGKVDKLLSENKALVDKNNSLDTMVTELQDKLDQAYKIIRSQIEDDETDHLQSTIRRQGSRNRDHIDGVNRLLGQLANTFGSAVNQHHRMSASYSIDDVISQGEIGFK